MRRFNNIYLKLKTTSPRQILKRGMSIVLLLCAAQSIFLLVIERHTQQLFRKTMSQLKKQTDQATARAREQSLLAEKTQLIHEIETAQAKLNQTVSREP